MSEEVWVPVPGDFYAEVDRRMKAEGLTMAQTIAAEPHSMRMAEQLLAVLERDGRVCVVDRDGAMQTVAYWLAWYMRRQVHAVSVALQARSIELDKGAQS